MLVNRQETFMEGLFHKTLWWCLDLFDAEPYIEFSDLVQANYGLESMTYDVFLDMLSEMSRASFERRVDFFKAQYTSDLGQVDDVMRQIVLTLRLKDDRVITLQCHLHCHKEAGNAYLWSVCSEVSGLVSLEADLVEAHSRSILREIKIKSEQAEKEQALLQQKYEQQSLFLAMLSHELRSPLLGMSQLIKQTKRQVPSGGMFAQNMSLLMMTVEQMTFMVNDILTFSQSQHHRLQVKNTPFSLQDMLNYVVHLTKSIAKEKNIMVSASTNFPDRCYEGDVLRVSQILINLIVNSIKYTRYGGVFIEVNAQKTEVEFKIVDSGEGIKPEKIADIFAPFTQLESGVSQAYLGSGLGLSVVKLLVDLLGGRLEVSSTEKVGTTFNVFLPLKCVKCYGDTEHHVAESDTPSVFLDINRASRSVLIADDSLINRKVLQQLLEEQGCVVDSAEDGALAFEAFMKNRYDFVFLDLQMPIMNGIESAQRMRMEIQNSSRVFNGKIFALTAAHTEEELLQTGMTVDKTLFDDWFLKPITQDQVMALMFDIEKMPYQHEATTTKVWQKKTVSEVKESAKATINRLSPALSELLPEFKKTALAELVELEAYCHAGQLEEASALAHRLKGSIMLFGYAELLDEIKYLQGDISQKELGQIMQRIYNSRQILLKLSY